MLIETSLSVEISNIEFYLKSGFMVTPNLSRDLDFGWGGTHAPLDSMHPHYVKMRESWIGDNKHKILDYFFKFYFQI